MNSFRHHYSEYLMEAAGLGIFMISAGSVTAILEHPASSIHQAITDPLLRRLVIGIGMGLTAIAIVYSPWGKQSGAHLNPAFTFAFFRLGKVKPWDTFFYILFQFLGGLIGLSLAGLFLREVLTHPSVNYIVTLPGPGGAAVAFLAEIIISFGMMLMVLFVSNHRRLHRYTGIFAAILIAIYITVEAPLSGMSMNPARSFASALSANVWTAFWVYATAPLTGMLLAAELYVRLMGANAVRCAKLHHHNNKRCIFRCGYREYATRNGSELSDSFKGLH